MLHNDGKESKFVLIYDDGGQIIYNDHLEFVADCWSAIEQEHVRLPTAYRNSIERALMKYYFKKAELINN